MCHQYFGDAIRPGHYKVRGLYPYSLIDGSEGAECRIG